MERDNRGQGVRAVAATRTEPQGGARRALAARGAAAALAVGICALALQSAATANPTWGYFSNPDAGNAVERGYFGPWRQCKLLLYGRERCGQGVSKFQPILPVWIAGLAAAGASVLLAILVGLAVLQLSMASSAKRVVVSYSVAVIGKVALATLATALAVVAASLFALQTDDRANSFVVTRGEAFYMQLAAIVLNFGVLVSAIYEGIYARKGGDPTKIRQINDPRATTINNPGYREHHRPANGELLSRRFNRTLRNLSLSDIYKYSFLSTQQRNKQ